MGTYKHLSVILSKQQSACTNARLCTQLIMQMITGKKSKTPGWENQNWNKTEIQIPHASPSGPTQPTLSMVCLVVGKQSLENSVLESPVSDAPVDFHHNIVTSELRLVQISIHFTSPKLFFSFYLNSVFSIVLYIRLFTALKRHSYCQLHGLCVELHVTQVRMSLKSLERKTAAASS